MATTVTLQETNLIRHRKPLLHVSYVSDFSAAGFVFIVLLHNNIHKGWHGPACCFRLPVMLIRGLVHMVSAPAVSQTVWGNHSFSLSDTSRAKRNQESDGVEYHFISKHLFETDIHNNKWAKPAGVIKQWRRHTHPTHCTTLDYNCIQWIFKLTWWK